MITLALLLAASLSGAAYPEDPEAWDRLPPEFVRDLESKVIMPSGASKLERYDRYYSVEWRGDSPVVVGLFLERRPEQTEGMTHRLYGPQRVDIAGGGCSVVNLAYEMDDGATPDLSCNGEDGADQPRIARRGHSPEAQVVDIRRR